MVVDLLKWSLGMSIAPYSYGGMIRRLFWRLPQMQSFGGFDIFHH